MQFNHTTSPVNLEFTHTNDASICIATLVLGNEVYVTRGSAKRHPEDKFDKEIAEKLSSARAIGNLTRKLAKQSAGKIKCNDDNRRRIRKPNPQATDELGTVVLPVIDPSTSPSLRGIATNRVGTNADRMHRR